MKRILLFIVVLLFTCTGIVRAQYDSQYSNYFMTMGYYNPAYAGINPDLNLFALHRQQWVGITRAPKSFLIMADMPFQFIGKEHGAGLVFYQESAGLFSNLHINLQYAYQMKLLGGKLNMGVQLGMVDQSFDGTKINLPSDDTHTGNMPEGTVPSTVVEGTGFDLSLGVYYKHPKLYAGIGVMHVMEPEILLGENTYTYIPRMYNLTAGYNIQTSNPLIELQPSVFMKTDLTSFQTDISARMIYNKMFNGGLSWRMNESIVLMLGATFGKFQVGYAYDFIISQMAGHTSGSHELFVKYSLKIRKNETRKNRHKSVRIL